MGLILLVAVLIFLINIVWQVRSVNSLHTTKKELHPSLDTSPVYMPKKQTKQVSNEKKKKKKRKKPKAKQKQIKINKFEVNNWRKMHGLIKKSKKTWKKGKRYGIASDRRR